MSNEESTTDGPTRGEMYSAAIDERRFEVEFNWRRGQYLIALSAALLAAGIATSQQSDGRASVILFVAGIIAAGITALVTKVQHDYYRTARDRVRAIEDDLGIVAPYRINTTTAMGGPSRLASVTQLTYGLLGALALADVAGIVYALTR